MEIIARREFLQNTGLSMIYSSVTPDSSKNIEMAFSIYYDTDVTLHRNIRIGLEGKKLEQEIQSAFNKINGLIDTLEMYQKQLQSNDVYEDHRGIGYLTDPVTNEYHGESSTVGLWVNGKECCFAITSCSKKVRFNAGKDELTEFLISLVTHLRLHLGDVETMIKQLS